MTAGAAAGRVLAAAGVAAVASIADAATATQTAVSFLPIRPRMLASPCEIHYLRWKSSHAHHRRSSAIETSTTPNTRVTPHRFDSQIVRLLPARPRSRVRVRATATPLALWVARWRAYAADRD